MATDRKSKKSKHEGEELRVNTTDRRMPSKDRDKHRAGKDVETKSERKAANRDPITSAPGAHPVGSGVGAAGGAAAGAAIGVVGGPVGAVTGGVLGGLVGGLAGKGVAEHFDPTHEHKYWQETFRDRDYVEGENVDYSRYSPAYQYGWESYCSCAREGRSSDFSEQEAELGRRWDEQRAGDDLTWDKARPAARDAWNRTDEMYGHQIRA